MCQSATTELVHMAIVAAEEAGAEPAELLAVTATTIVLPTSALVSV
jgi:hypothetical protein